MHLHKKRGLRQPQPLAGAQRHVLRAWPRDGAGDRRATGLFLCGHQRRDGHRGVLQRSHARRHALCQARLHARSVYRAQVHLKILKR